MKRKRMIKLMIMVIMVAMLIPITKVNAETRNNNPLLREITVNGKAIEPEFDQFITDYVMAVDGQTKTIEIKAVTDDPNASAQIIGDTNLKNGVNDFEIKVTAEDGKTTNSYFLHITKGEVEKANANLKNIEVEGWALNPQFNEKDTNYLVEYEGYVENFKITATPESEKAKVEILDNNNFSGTIHVVTIKVTAEDGITTKEYKLTAKKAGESLEDPSGLEEHEEEMKQKQEEKNNNIWMPIGIVGIILIIGMVVKVAKKGRKK